MQAYQIHSINLGESLFVCYFEEKLSSLHVSEKQMFRI